MTGDKRATIIIRYWKITLHFPGIGHHLSSLLFQRIIIPLFFYSQGVQALLRRTAPAPKTSTILISTMKTKAPPSRSGGVFAQMSERVLTFRKKGLCGGLCVGFIQCRRAFYRIFGIRNGPRWNSQDSFLIGTSGLTGFPQTSMGRFSFKEPTGGFSIHPLNISALLGAATWVVPDGSLEEILGFKTELAKRDFRLDSQFQDNTAEE